MMKVVKFFPAEYAARVKRVKHKANVCARLTLSRPVSEYYWTTIAEKDAPFVLFIEHTNLFGDPAYENASIAYLSKYLDEDDPLFRMDDIQVRKIFLGYLKKLFPTFSEDSVLDFAVNRCRYSQPVVGMRHSEVVLPLETGLRNLYLASMSQIYPEDRGQNYAVWLGQEAARRIMGVDKR
jgi:protoporphyrinogen oxidase